MSTLIRRYKAKAVEHRLLNCQLYERTKDSRNYKSTFCTGRIITHQHNYPYHLEICVCGADINTMLTRLQS